jgi:DNA-binding PadR family transcriptional regulator
MAVSIPELTYTDRHMQALSKLQHQLLAAIFTNPGMHGYALLQSQDAAVSSVYEALRVLSARGLVEKRLATRSNAPIAFTFFVTNSGRMMLLLGDSAREIQIDTLREKYLKALRHRI